MGYAVSIYENESEAQDAFLIRNKVFTEEQKIPAHLDRDIDDAISIHVVLYKTLNTPVATGRLTVKDKEVGHLSRIAVLQEERGQGLSKKIIETLEQAAARKGLKELLLYPHDYLEDYYRKFGYQRTGEPVKLSANVHLIEMRKTLTN